ncbi:MAG: MipA/OmpV family protein [Geminicoccaceae bacterium]
MNDAGAMRLLKNGTIPRYTFLAIILVTASSAALAEHSLTIGLAGSFETDPLEDEDDSFGVAPIVQYANDDFLGGILSLGYIEASYARILPDGFVGSVSVSARDAPVDDIDDFDRETAVEIGGELQYFQPFGIFSLGVSTDVAGAYSGVEIEAAYTKLHELGDWEFEASIGGAYRSGGLGTYLYGVKNDDEDSGLDAFRVDGHVVPQLELGANYNLSDSWTILSSISAEYLPDAVTDSPAVEDAYEVSTIIGLIYEFSF